VRSPLWTVTSLIDSDPEIAAIWQSAEFNVVFETAASGYCRVGY